MSSETSKTFAVGIDALYDARAHAEELRRLLLSRSTSLADGVAPTEVRERLDALQRALETSRVALSSGPREKFMRGARLTAEEFYLSRLAGIAFPWAQSFGVGAAHDAEAFDHHFYEDDERVGYINPARSTKTDASESHSLLGIAPENVRVDALRPAQREFWERYSPTVFARFRR